jgi:hypothetical protein
MVLPREWRIETMTKLHILFLLCMFFLGCGKSTIESFECGNQRLDPGELCDIKILSGIGSCPTEATCKTVSPCSELGITGTGCQASCIITNAVTDAIDNDGCCPAGMTIQDDNDCDQAQVVVLELEAESGNTIGQMQIESAQLSDPACADSWIEVPGGNEDYIWRSSSPSLPEHRIEIPVNLPVDDTYYLWVRMASPSGAQDAMYVGFEASDMRRIFPPEDYAYDQSWYWFTILDGDAARLSFDELSAGSHKLILGHGEAGARIDKVILTNDRNAQFDLSCGDSPGDVCGDGAITGNEVCDPNGNLLNGASCLSEGYIGGVLGCRLSCLAYDFSNCVSALDDVCGDGEITGNEVCDTNGNLLNGATCQSEGYDSGQLGCKSDCLAYDFSNCASEPDDVCGDGAISGNEVCDTNGDLLGGATCQSEGYESGQLSCSPDCLQYDYSGCYASGESCGDGLITGNEACDTNGNKLNGATCLNQGYLGSGLSCRSDCHAFDFTACDIPVVPGARGFGITTAAGRGGTIYKVTNLNDSGSGSLRAAIEASGPRVVIFEVSGMITLQDDLVIENDDITIAGQTAPSPGITLRSRIFNVQADDVLIQHIRMRLGDVAPDGEDAWKIGGVSRVVIDHCSSAWGRDGTLDSYGTDVTVRHTIMSHTLDPHAYAMLLNGGSRIAIIGNYYAHNKDRHPRDAAGAAVVNNLIYNSANDGHNIYFGDSDYNAKPLKSSAIGNVIISDNENVVSIEDSTPSGSQIYIDDNGYKTSYGGSMGSGDIHNDASSSLLVSSNPIPIPGYESLPREQVVDWVLANVGARPNDRDSYDEQLIQDVINGTGDRISSQDEIGGWPDLAENHRALTVPDNPHSDPDLNGYTNLEEWLHGFAQGVEN